MAADLVFGKYEIQHRLAVGGMGEVFYAVQKGVPGFERPVILKSLLPDLAQQEGFIDQFLDEARVAATLNHPNVVSIFEVGLWNDTYFIAMEYIRGRNLAQLARRAVENQTLMPPVVAGQIIHDAAIGLHHAHTAADHTGQPAGIVHRDISPQNIMVRDDGVTKVVDFGIARGANRATRTATGTLKGKLAYMAPEQILGKDIGPALDQFALGIVFWELLTGRRLFRADSDLAIVHKVLEEEIPSPLTLVPDLPPQFVAVVMKMLERQRERRYLDCGEAATALSDAMVGLTPTGANPVLLFMRRLGTDDLVVKVRTTSKENFVISLQRGGGPAEARGQASTATMPAPSSPTPHASAEARAALEAMAPAPRPEPGDEAAPSPLRSPVVAVIGAVALAVAAAVVWKATRPEPPAPPTVMAVAPPAELEVAPVVPPAPAPPVAEPAKAPGRVTLSVSPGGTIRLDGRPLGAAPQAFDVSPGVVHYVTVERKGYKPHERELTLSSGEARTVEVVLEALARPAGGAATTRLPAPPPPPPVRAETAGPGFLTVETEPWSKVNIDGSPAGSTPLFKVKLSPGRHTLVFVNEGESINKTMPVEISAGVITKLREKLK